MILFERFLFSRKLYNDILHHSIHWKTPTHRYMIAFSRSTIRRDWWKTREEEEAQFFSVEWKQRDEDYIRTGIYIGRCAVVILKCSREGVPVG